MLIHKFKKTAKSEPFLLPRAYSAPFPVYEPQAIETKWQKKWVEEPSSQNPNGVPKYVLSMFPYPSGSLHMGHARVYTISDTVSRFYSLRGFNVLHPMGWDAFGLPAENAAIERGIMPHPWTKQNIAQMKETLVKLGYQFDWGKELCTCDEKYYKWTQWLFLQLYNDKLAYQKSSYVNWDPVDLTVLANEQVDDKGRSWRSGAVVEKKLMKQWYLKITQYSERLLNDLKLLSHWPKNIVKMQHEWIGKKEGVEIAFVLTPNVKAQLATATVKVFTTRPETIFGVSYIVLAPEYASLQDLIPDEEKVAVNAYLTSINHATDQQRQESKTGQWTGRMAVHPVTRREVPVYIAAYVLADFGSGAVMGVPRHDARDKIFAETLKIYDESVTVLSSNHPNHPEKEVLLNSGDFTGLGVKEGKEAIVNYLEQNRLGKKVICNSLRDWLVSRQRYWGCPIPIIHCNTCGVVPVPEKDLPVSLPREISFVGKGSPLASLADWVNVKCPCCGGAAKRETDTLDTFVDSSWYFLRFPDANNDNEAFSQSVISKWNPVDIYVGGIEHAILHLLYSRFIMKYLYDKKLVTSNEPFKLLKAQGMVHGKTFKNSVSGRYLKEEEVIVKDDHLAFDKTTSEQVEITYEKMSKSKYNGVDPKLAIATYGADVVRLYILFKAPMELILDWDVAQIQGQSRWLRRIWLLAMHYIHYLKLKHENKLTQATSSTENAIALSKITKVLQPSIRKVTSDLELFSFNTAISQLMILSNEIRTETKLSSASEFPTTRERDLTLESKVIYDAISSLLVMMSPMAPHFVSEVVSIWKAEVPETPENKSTFPYSCAWPHYESTADVKVKNRVRE